MTSAAAASVARHRERVRAGLAVLRIGKAPGAPFDYGDTVDTLISQGLLLEWDSEDQGKVAEAIVRALRVLSITPEEGGE